jgi:hypothetical protein
MTHPETFLTLIGLILGTLNYSEKNWEKDALLVVRVVKGRG